MYVFIKNKNTVENKIIWDQDLIQFNVKQKQ
jgi:hypothetical protein